MPELKEKKAHLKALLSKIPPMIAGACSVQTAVQYKKDAAIATKVLNATRADLSKISSACASMEKYWR